MGIIGRSWASNKNRRTETALAKLRLGHVGLKKHLYRFNQAESPLCLSCNSEETIEHFFINCVNHVSARRKMIRNLRAQNIVNPSIADLLGGENFKEDDQHKIGAIVSTYLSETRKLYEL